MDRLRFVDDELRRMPFARDNEKLNSKNFVKNSRTIVKVFYLILINCANFFIE